MSDFTALFQAIIGVIADFGRMSSRRLFQPVLTALFLSVIYIAIHIGQEGSILAGFRSAVLENDTMRSERNRLAELTVLQVELRRFAAADKLINQKLEAMLPYTGGASRIRLGVIHNGVTSANGTGLLRYDETNSVATPGQTPGISLSNQSLSEWSDFLPDLLAGRCSLHPTEDLRALSLRARLELLGVTNVLVCPVTDSLGRLLGATFTSWDAKEATPNPKRLQELMIAGLRHGTQIAALLVLRRPLRLPDPEQPVARPAIP